MANRELASDVKLVSSIPPAAARTADTTGVTVDLRGFDSACFEVHFGVNVDGTWTPKLQHGDLSDGSDAVDVTATDLKQNGFVAVTTANDDAVYKCAYTGSKRYVRVVVIETAASTGGFFSALGILGHAEVRKTQ